MVAMCMRLGWARYVLIALLVAAIVGFGLAVLDDEQASRLSPLPEPVHAAVGGTSALRHGVGPAGRFARRCADFSRRGRRADCDRSGERLQADGEFRAAAGGGLNDDRALRFADEALDDGKAQTRCRAPAAWS